MPALAIRDDLSVSELRRLARHEPDRRAAMRLLAIANALDGTVPGGSRPAGRDGAPGAARCGGALQCRRAGWAARPAEVGPARGADARSAGGAQSLDPAWARSGAGRGECLAGRGHLRSRRESLRRALQRLGHEPPAPAAWSVAPEDPAAAPQQRVRPPRPPSKKAAWAEARRHRQGPSGPAAATVVRG